MSDPVNSPSHYNAHPGGMECIELVEMLPFCEGNAIKYLWRAGLKGSALEDLNKARWYIRRAEDGCWWPKRLGLAEAIDRACAGFEEPLIRESIRTIAEGYPQLAIGMVSALIRELAVKAGEQEEAA